MENTEEKFTDMEVTQRRSHICLISVPEEERETKTETIFEKMMVENFPEWTEDIHL